MKNFITLIIGFLTFFTFSCSKNLTEDEKFWNMSKEKMGKIVRDMSTSELLQKCLSYPYWYTSGPYSTPGTAFGVAMSETPVFSEFFSRYDSSTELLKVYKKMDPLAVDHNWTGLEKGRFATRIQKVEYLIIVMIDILDASDLRNLKEEVISKYQKKKSLLGSGIFWESDLSYTVGVCVNIIEKVNSELLDGRRLEVNYFKFYLMVDSTNLQFLDDMIELLKSIEI